MLQATLRKGQEVLLDIKDSARRRVICGLSWDPMLKDSGAAAALVKGGTSDAHDLDLLCILFDKYGRFINGVTGMEGQRVGDSGNIYHTGDVIEGEDVKDDEQISLELFNLSSKIHQIAFIAEVQSGHSFGDIESPAIRLANAIDDRNFAHTLLNTGSGADKNAFIFGLLYRHQKGWMFRQIGEFFDGSHIEDWSETLSEYLIKEARPGAAGRAGLAAPKKGQTVPLHYSKEARQRVLCGLNWDPSPDGEEMDLDLACVVYNADGEAVDGVSADPTETIDSSGKIYHSGDDTSGEGSTNDDESISVELKDIPDYIQHIVFVAEIQSGHTFGDINSPMLRIADGKTNDDQLTLSLSSPAAQHKDCCVFARISQREGRWTLTLINEYFDAAEIDDWVSHLQRYLG